MSFIHHARAKKKREEKEKVGEILTNVLPAEKWTTIQTPGRRQQSSEDSVGQPNWGHSQLEHGQRNGRWGEKEKGGQEAPHNRGGAFQVTTFCFLVQHQLNK